MVLVSPQWPAAREALIAEKQTRMAARSAAGMAGPQPGAALQAQQQQQLQRGATGACLRWCESTVTK